MVGLHWSIKSKGTIGSVVAAVGLVVVVVGGLSLCGVLGGQQISYPGAAFSAISPVNLLLAMVMPERMIPDALGEGGAAAALTSRISLIVGSAVAAVAYAAIVFGMHTNIKRTFMMTVRRLAGAT